MHLKSLTLKGFKSFPDRTKLDFASGVSVVVGPNGSGKSNVTDAVLWAMGEQSPLAVRGQSMQDVIFGGGKGVQARSAAEVELVLDNSDGVVDLPLGEISILRRLDRSGEGEYRLNGARCRLVDILEILSDTGLGKESHSVVSQGRVEAIVTSKPRDRRLLIEEAAGLGKHRKRRRRAQLKLERTQDNLDRALDVEREARSRLRPLKRQAEAAELHERLERQTVEARWELARDAVRARREELARRRERRHRRARRARGGAGAQLAEVAAAARRPRTRWRGAPRSARRSRGACSPRARRPSASSCAWSARARRPRRSPSASSAAGASSRACARRPRRTRRDEAGRERIEALAGRSSSELDAQRAEALERELAALAAQRDAAAARAAELAEAVEERRAALAEADEACDVARTARRAAESSAEAARREAARVGAELASANQFLRTHAAAPGNARVAGRRARGRGRLRAGARRRARRTAERRGRRRPRRRPRPARAGREPTAVARWWPTPARRAWRARPRRPRRERATWATWSRGPRARRRPGPAAAGQHVGRRGPRSAAAGLPGRGRHARRPRVVRLHPRAAPGAARAARSACWPSATAATRS